MIGEVKLTAEFGGNSVPGKLVNSGQTRTPYEIRFVSGDE